MRVLCNLSFVQNTFIVVGIALVTPCVSGLPCVQWHNKVLNVDQPSHSVHPLIDVHGRDERIEKEQNLVVVKPEKLDNVGMKRNLSSFCKMF